MVRQHSQVDLKAQCTKENSSCITQVDQKPRNSPPFQFQNVSDGFFRFKGFKVQIQVCVFPKEMCREILFWTLKAWNSILHLKLNTNQIHMKMYVLFMETSEWRQRFNGKVKRQGLLLRRDQPEIKIVAYSAYSDKLVLQASQSSHGCFLWTSGS